MDTKQVPSVRPKYSSACKAHTALALSALLAMIAVSGCIGGGGDEDEGSYDAYAPPVGNYRQYMRDLVQNISAWSKGQHGSFSIIPQNGHQLMTVEGMANKTPATTYLDAIDGVGREDLFYGYEEDNKATPQAEREPMTDFMDLAASNGVKVLAIDYCSGRSNMDDSYAQSAARGYISFAADHRDLDNIPQYPERPYNVNSDNITSLAQAKNFLYLINPGSYPDKAAFLSALQATDFDAIIMDLFYEDQMLTLADIAGLRTKANGGSRLVIAYMSIGEAEDYRYYWQSSWKSERPSWLDRENPDWEGNYKVRYWDPAWQAIIYGNEASYLQKILDAGFDGAYLDIIDAFEYYEELDANR